VSRAVIADPAVYAAGGIPHEAFAELRRNDPVHWTPWDNVQGGFWSITRHPDVYAVSRDAKTFCSGEFTNLFELSEEAKAARRSIIDSDAPLHTRLRHLVLPPFTMRKVEDYAAITRSITAELLDGIVGAGPVDLVSALSEPLPIRVIVGILGVPPDDADYMVDLSNQLVEGTSHREVDPGAYGNTTPLELLPFNSPASHALFEYGRELGARRRAEPASDLVSTLVHAEVDGDRLTDAEFCNFFQLLVFAGNETTRTAISHGLLALMEHPEQLERLHDDPALIPTAVEEIIRWATPVLHMRRTATVDATIGDTGVAEGDWVVMWYASSNFDDDVLAEPLRFDVGRPLEPAAHQAFGGHGPHHCLGAHLARLEIRVVLEEIVARGLRFEQAGDVARVPSNFVNGIASLSGTVWTDRV
jgi:cytochrome P450